MSKSLSDLVGGALFLGLTILFWTQTMDQPSAGQGLANNPFWQPRLLLVLMGLASLLLIGKGLLRSEGKKRIQLPSHPGQLVLGVAIVALFLLTFEPLGFLLSGCLLVVLFCIGMGYRAYGVVVVFALLFVSLVWYAFADGFSIRPPGMGMDTIFNMLFGGMNG